MKILIMLALLGLTACGINGAPSSPGPSAQVSGEARIGVVGGL